MTAAATTLPLSTPFNAEQLASLNVGDEVWVKIFDEIPVWAVYRGTVSQVAAGHVRLKLKVFDKPPAPETIDGLTQVFTDLFSVESVRVPFDSNTFLSSLGYAFVGLKNRIIQIGCINGLIEPYRFSVASSGAESVSVLRFTGNGFPVIEPGILEPYSNQLKLSLGDRGKHVVFLEPYQAMDGALVGEPDSSQYPERILLLNYAPASIGAPVDLRNPEPGAVYWHRWAELGKPAVFRKLKFLKRDNDVFTLAEETGTVAEPAAPVRYDLSFIDDTGYSLSHRGGQWELYECSEPVSDRAFGGL